MVLSAMLMHVAETLFLTCELYVVFVHAVLGYGQKIDCCLL